MSLNVPVGHALHTVSEVYSFRILSNVGGDVNTVPGGQVFVGRHAESEESVPSTERYSVGYVHTVWFTHNGAFTSVEYVRSKQGWQRRFSTAVPGNSIYVPGEHSVFAMHSPSM